MFRTLTTLEWKLQLRNPLTMFFSFAFPVMMLLIFGAMYGNEPSDFTGGWGAIDTLLPGYICMIVAVTGLMALPLTLATYREQKILKRFMATPIQPREILLAQLIVNAITTLIGVLLLLIVAIVVYDLKLPTAYAGFSTAFVLVILSIFSLGLAIAGIAKNGQTATTLSYLIYFPMLFLSGATMPLYLMPKSIITISKALPLTYGVRLLSGIWLGGRFLDYGLELGVLTATTLVFGGLAIRYFKWE